MKQIKPLREARGIPCYLKKHVTGSGGPGDPLKPLPQHPMKSEDPALRTERGVRLHNTAYTGTSKGSKGWRFFLFFFLPFFSLSHSKVFRVCEGRIATSAEKKMEPVWMADVKSTSVLLFFVLNYSGKATCPCETASCVTVLNRREGSISTIGAIATLVFTVYWRHGDVCGAATVITELIHPLSVCTLCRFHFSRLILCFYSNFCPL